MKFVIYANCQNCNGAGDVERTVGGWTVNGPHMEYVASPCEECGGHGTKRYHDDHYESLDDAYENNPTALYIEVASCLKK